MTIHTEIAEQSNDARILAAWGRRSVAYALYNSDDHDQDNLEPLNTVDRAENEIRRAVATTPLGAEIQLWCVLFHTDIALRSADCEAANIMDLEFFMSRESDFDWGDRLLLAAIKSLRTMRIGGAA